MKRKKVCLQEIFMKRVQRHRKQTKKNHHLKTSGGQRLDVSLSWGMCKHVQSVEQQLRVCRIISIMFDSWRGSHEWLCKVP